MEASQPEVEKTPDSLQGTVFAADSEQSQMKEEAPAQQEESAPAQQEQTMDLSDVEVTNENIALNIIVSYVNLAQKRGAFNIKESAKIWECIQKFQRASP
tara:strand:+ start:84 stop:383 length:300 start_codon:yes stop_codon:yes gene_type:complete